MKISKVIGLFILVCLSFHAEGQIRSNKDLIGRWSTPGLKLEFMPDGRLMFTMRGGTIPGARYKTDFTRIPAVLHIELEQTHPKIIYRSTIVFINDDSFQLTKLDNDPAHAFDKQSSIVLKKER